LNKKSGAEPPPFNFQENRRAFVQWIEDLGKTHFFPYAWTVLFHPKTAEPAKKKAMEHSINLISRRLHSHPRSKNNTRARAVMFSDEPSPQWPEQTLGSEGRVDRREHYGSHLHGVLFIPRWLNHKVQAKGINDPKDYFLDPIRARIPQITKFHREPLYSPNVWLSYCNKAGSLRDRLLKGEDWFLF
jgi:hypothetical protein